MDFNDAYIERIDKMTEETLAKENAEFFQQPIAYFKKHKNEFLYVESNKFELIKVDAVSIEVDDVFGTYDVMLGLKLPKKMGSTIKSELKSQLENENSTFDLLFNGEDGLWDLNFSLNDIAGFKEEMTIGEAYSLIYGFLSSIVKAVAK
ncbi:branched-chain amino acid aminotransferase [Schinkia sp. CFF1]